MGVGPLKRRAVFLDRDGVLNRAILREGRPYPPSGVGELEILPGVPEALSRLRRAGFYLIVVTNQPDVARGTQARETVETIHLALQARLPLDAFRVCYHDDGDHCVCRKPRPGLLLDAAREAAVDLSASYMVGDRWRDIEAGQRAGCTTVLIDYGYAEARRSEPDARVKSIAEAADWILKHTEEEQNLMATLVNTRISSDSAVTLPQLERLPASLQRLRVKIFADGADQAGMLEMYAKPYVKGFTTNPTLMRKAGISDYRAFAKEILQAIPDRPISFEVFSDEFEEMDRQAREIAGWGEPVYVKIPVTNTRREAAYDLVKRLSRSGVKVNVTALMTLQQVREVVDAVAGGAPCYVSVFAGRIADTGRDPMPLMAAAMELLQLAPNAELIWASPRELLNIFQADAVGCHIITATNDILKKLILVDKELAAYSLDTVKMFYRDAQQAGYKL